LGKVTYTSDNDFSGKDSFKFRVTDSFGAQSNAGTISITVSASPENTNNPPEAKDKQVTVQSGVPSSISLEANDDPDETNLRAFIERYPEHGSLGEINQDLGEVTYTSDNDFSGKDSFKFRVTDSFGAQSNAGTISITVSSGNPGSSYQLATVNVKLTGPESANSGDKVKLEAKLMGIEMDKISDISFTQTGGPEVEYSECEKDNPDCSYPSIKFNMPSCPAEDKSVKFKLKVTDNTGRDYFDSQTVNLNCSNDNNGSGETDYQNENQGESDDDLETDNGVDSNNNSTKN